MTIRATVVRIVGDPRLLGARERVRAASTWAQAAVHRISWSAHREEVPSLLSVVVPVYNVDSYLEEMLLSVRRQTYRKIEIVAVDDGSTDGSSEILRRIARREPRLRVVTKVNAGLGAARNTGLRVAKGEYITFIDSDDTVDRHAFKYTVETLDKTRSDFAVAPYRRLIRDQERAAGPWIYQAHEVERRATNLSAFPQIQVNAVAWSKVYRTRFLEESKIEFPVGMLYEDQPVSTRAYAAAHAFDVLTHPAVNWRVRDDRSSISQSALSVRNTTDHLNAARSSLETLSAAGLKEPRLERLRQLLANDYSHDMPFLPNATDEEWEAFTAAVRSLSDEAGDNDDVWTHVHARNKICFWLLINGHRSSLIAFLLAGNWNTTNMPTVVLGDQLRVVRPRNMDLLRDVPDQAFILSPFETRLRSETSSVRWTRPAELEVQGHAVVNGLDPRSNEVEISAELVSLESGRRHPVKAAFTPDPLDTTAFTTPYVDGSRAHFTIYAKLDELANVPAEYELELTLRSGELKRTRSLHMHRHAPAAPSRLIGNYLVDHYADRRGFFTLGISLPVAKLHSASTVGRRIEVHIRSSHKLKRAAVINTNDRFQLPLSATRLKLLGNGLYRATLTLPVNSSRPVGSSVDTRHSWRLVVNNGSKSWHEVASPDTADLEGDSAQSGAFAFERTIGGTLLHDRRMPSSPRRLYIPGSTTLIVEQARRATATGFEINGAKLVVHLTSSGVRPDAQAILWSSKASLSAPLTLAGDGSKVEFDLAPSIWGIAREAPPKGDYTLSIENQGGPLSVNISGLHAQELPLVLFADNCRVMVAANSDREVVLSFGVPVKSSAASSYALSQARTDSFTSINDRDVRRTVLFRSLYGEVAGDSAEAIHHELRKRGSNLRLLWATADGSVPIPVGGERVYEGSTEFVHAMSSSKYVVVNVHQPDWFVKAPNQVLIQTMHGYPFKLAGRRHWESTNLPPSRIESFLARADQWDFFVSPSSYATPLLKEFLPVDWAGEILEMGYPRNDVLLGDTTVLRAETRHALGIGTDKTAVLYAPTYRDYLSIDEFRARAMTDLNLPALASATRETHTILVRGHVMNSRTGYSVQAPNVIDVTNHPSIAALTLASDAAILDYSSLRFDYALTEKPMLFFNPDRDRYFESRPSMVPYDGTAPGPWLNTTNEVIRSLRQLNKVQSTYAGAVREFRDRFMELEDGKSAARVVDRVFAVRGDA